LKTLLIPNNSTLRVVILALIFFFNFGEVFSPSPSLNIDFQVYHSNPKVSQNLNLFNAPFPSNFGVVSVHTKLILATVSNNHKYQANNIPENPYGKVVINYYKYNIYKYQLHPQEISKKLGLTVLT
jgi:hypothetical protein